AIAAATRDGRRHGVRHDLELLVDLPQSFLALSSGRDIAEHHDDADHLPVTIAHGSGAIVDGAFGPVLGDQHGMVCQTDDGAVTDDACDRTLDRLPCLFI